MAEQRPDRPTRKPGRPGTGNGAFRFRNGLLGWLLFIGLAVMLVILVSKSKTTQTAISVDVFYKMLDQDKIHSITVEDPEITGKFKNPESIAGAGPAPIKDFKVTFPVDWLRNQGFTEISKRAEKQNTKLEAENNNNILVNIILPFIPWLLIFGFIWFFVFRQLRSAGGANMLGNFGKSRARINSKEHTHVTFEDVAGVEEAKDEVMEIVEFLKNPKKFQRLGGRIPRGVLLVGEPGTGKTL